MSDLAPDDGRVLIAPGVRVDPAALSFTFARGGGPGGQNVNKVNTHAVLTVSLDALAGAMPGWAIERLREIAGRYLAAGPDRLVIHAADSRSQLTNRRSCLAKLRHLIVEATDRPRIRRPTRPSAGAVQRRIDNKKHRSRVKALRRPPE
ncbi:MAG: alternative ribosome rescue aminoacyl-tRNA hydrolase ArfB [Planctomycetota bacterium]